MRHEVPLVVPDPFLYAERDSSQHVVASSFELDRIKAVAPHLELLPYEEFGLDDLYAQGLSRDEIELEVILRAARRFGIEKAAVPATFPLEVADHLRANGIEVTGDRESGCFADMTRVFVVGEPSEELAEYHRLCREALEVSVAAVKPGVPGSELNRICSKVFEEHGYPTLLSKAPGEVLKDGFYHSLGHGVGLEVHEDPSLGRGPGELVAGDVIAVEPGLYRHGYGGCRLRGLVLGHPGRPPGAAGV